MRAEFVRITADVRPLITTIFLKMASSHIDEALVDKLIESMKAKHIDTREKLFEPQTFISEVVGRRGSRRYLNFVKNCKNPRTYHYQRLFMGTFTLL